MAKKKNVQIIYQDDQLLVINKPSGTSVTKDRSGKKQLLDLLSDQLPTETISALRLIHRLDKPTSGIMMLAKTKEAQSKYSHCFEKNLIEKTYLVLVTGFVPPKGFGQINARIIPDRNKPGRMTLTRKKGKDAKTIWRLLADYQSAALLAAQLVTGRTHQIRIHIPSIGLPLLIDPLYGSSKPVMLSDFKPRYRIAKHKEEEKPLIDRLTLHAYQLKFKEPQPDCPDHFIAPLDKNFKAAIKMITKHNPKGMDAFKNPEDFNKIINAELLD